MTNGILEFTYENSTEQFALVTKDHGLTGIDFSVLLGTSSGKSSDYDVSYSQHSDKLRKSAQQERAMAQKAIALTPQVKIGNYTK